MSENAECGMRNAELKPVRCGCGGEAILKHYCYSYGDDDQYYFVWCERCDIQTKTYPTEAEAIEAWNKAMSGHTRWSNLADVRPEGVYCKGCGYRMDCDE